MLALLPLCGLAQKKITASVEIMPNYVWHILASSNVWDDPENPYDEAYGHTIPAADKQFIYDHRTLFAWGNSRLGTLTVGVFFAPLQQPTTIDDYLAFREDFSTTMPDSLQAIYRETSRIFRENYEAFEQQVWPGIEPKLLQAKGMIEARFVGEDPIARWEENLGRSFPGEGKELVLSYANWVNGLPSANNFSMVRNNIAIVPEETAVGHIYELVLHEIGVFTCMPLIESLMSDPTLQTGFLQQGNSVYVAIETFFEKRKDDLFAGPKRVFLSQWEAQYHWFYDYFTRHDRPSADIEAVLRSAIAEYVRVNQAL